jgi:subtilisin-like proprotein convertase family protein
MDRVLRQGQSRAPITRWMTAALLMAAAGLAHAQQAIMLDPPGSARLSGIAALPAQTFLIETPAARTSRASRVEADGRMDGYIFHGRVVIGADGLDEATVRASLARAGISKATLSPVTGVPGYWTLEAASVNEAAVLTGKIRKQGFAKDVYVDLEQPRLLRWDVNDPAFNQQWHLVNTVNPTYDVNVEWAWEHGYVGTGVTIGIVEGPFEVTHEDLAANFDVEASMSGGSPTSHATAVAGVAAAVANNNLGGVGAAWGARLARIVYGTSAQNAVALAHRNDLNDIKNNSWGPPDNNTLWTMTPAEKTAIREATITGRGGLGTVLVWASGNGGLADRMDYDPFASSRYVLPIGGIGDRDQRSTFNEAGSATFMVAQSDKNGRTIYTTDLMGSPGYSPGNYYHAFGGSSSSAPLAAGVVACMLQANPDLSWRDVQHVLINTARKCDPGNPGWKLNGAGRWVSYDFGYGAIDMSAAVERSRVWRTVGNAVEWESPVQSVALQIPDNNPQGLVRGIDVPIDFRVETVEVTVNITTTFVGEIELLLTSPSGVESLLAVATRADSQDNMVNYTFTSRRHWDEVASGSWTLRAADRRANTLATWVDWKLGVFGRACPADVDGSGFVDTDDFTMQAMLVQAMDPLGDYTRDGLVNSDDLDRFVVDFESGC